MPEDLVSDYDGLLANVQSVNELLLALIRHLQSRNLVNPPDIGKIMQERLNSVPNQPGKEVLSMMIGANIRLMDEI